MTAEDGHVYERAAIREWISKNGKHSKSPLTNQPMGPTLLSAVGVRNAIETLINSGAVTGELADSWMERKEEKVAVERLLENAVAGSPPAMLELYKIYRFGRMGVEKSSRKAKHWATRGAVQGQHTCMYLEGAKLVKTAQKDQTLVAQLDMQSRKVQKVDVKFMCEKVLKAVPGIAYLTRAAMEGSSKVHIAHAG